MCTDICSHTNRLNENQVNLKKVRNLIFLLIIILLKENCDYELKMACVTILERLINMEKHKAMAKL